MSVEVVAYNSSIEGNVKVASNFTVKEFRSSDSRIVFIHKLLPQGLQKIRDKVGNSVTLTNAYRTDSHNQRVGGASNSYHLFGMAADIYVEGMQPLQLAKIVDGLFPDKYCVIAYPKKGIVHFDVRTKKYRAINDGKEKAVSTF